MTKGTGKLAPRPRRHQDWLLAGKNIHGCPLSSSDPLQTLNLIFLISSVTTPPARIPFAQITSVPFHTLSLPLRRLLRQPQSPLPEPLSLVIPEVPIFLSLPSLVGSHRHRPRRHRCLQLSAQPTVLTGGRHPLSSTPQSLLHNLFHLLQLSSLHNLLRHGQDTVFPQTPRQELPLPKAQIVHSPLFPIFPTEPLLDPPSQHPHTEEIRLLVARAARPLRSLLNARLAPITHMLRVFNRLMPLMCSHP